MTSSLHAPTSTRGTARLDIWTVNVTEPVLDGCSLPLQQGTSSYYLPARRPTGSPVPSLPPCTRDERDQVFGIRPGLGHSGFWPAAATATTDYEESGEKVIGTGSKWLWLWCWVIMSDMMGGGSHLPARAGQARGISAEQLPSRAEQSRAEQSRAEQSRAASKQGSFQRLHLYRHPLTTG